MEENKMNSRVLPAKLTDIVNRAQSIKEVQRLLRDVPGVQPLSAYKYQVEGLFIQVDWAYRLEPLLGTLRTLEPLDLGIAPVVVAYRELEDRAAILVTQYPTAPKDRFVPVSSANGPFRNAAKAEFLRSLERLHKAGFYHPLASSGFDDWMFAEDRGVIVLDTWWALQELRDPGDAKEDLERIADVLDRVLPWRQRVADKAEELRRVLGHTDPSGEAQALSLLAQAGYPLEAELWGAHLRGEAATTVPDGRWHGRTAHLGRDAPSDAKLGDLWFDPRELGVMLRIRSGWLALRVLEPWQCVRTTRAVPSSCIVGPAGDPVVDLTWHEATALAEVFGKTLPKRGDWSVAMEELSRGMFESLWSGYQPEWTSTPSPAAPDEVAFVSMLSMAFDFEEHAVREAGLASMSERSVVARRDERQRQFTMRTFLRVQG